MYAGIEGKEFRCTISGHCRTQIFEFPRIKFRPNADEPHHSIYDSPSVQASVTSNLVGYFANATCGRHYAISPCLQHAVGETDKKIRSQQKGSVPVFLVREDDVVVAGNKTLRELTEYRDDIAHWWTDTIDKNFLADLRRTINELIRRRYF